MLHLFKPKNYRKATTLLDKINFNSEDFREFHLENIESNLKDYEILFSSFREIIY
jgi:hypothetical protein